jgi:hypothetical protein
MMTDDTLAQGYIRAIAQRMTLERHELIERDLVRRAYPPTGEADDTPIEGTSLTKGDHVILGRAINPNIKVISETTLQRLQAAMGPAFRCHYRGQEAAYEIHRVAKTDDMIEVKTREEIKRIGDAAMDLYMKTPTFTQPNEFQIATVAEGLRRESGRPEEMGRRAPRMKKPGRHL